MRPGPAGVWRRGPEPAPWGPRPPSRDPTDTDGSRRQTPVMPEEPPGVEDRPLVGRVPAPTIPHQAVRWRGSRQHAHAAAPRPQHKERPLRAGRGAPSPSQPVPPPITPNPQPDTPQTQHERQDRQPVQENSKQSPHRRPSYPARSFVLIGGPSAVASCLRVFAVQHFSATVPHSGQRSGVARRS